MIGCRDPFIEVDGKGIEKMQAAGIEVVTGVLEKESKWLNRRFLAFHSFRRPYLILKWAETADKKIGNFGNDRLRITNELTDRLVHKWRSEEAGIMAGTNTVASDDPQLTNRLWKGNNPVRIVIDKELRLPESLRIFDGTVKTVVFNFIRHGEEDNILYYQVAEDVNLVHQVVNSLYQMKILSVIIEGGAQLLQSFIDEDLWDEARVITNGSMTIGEGVHSPELINERCIDEEKIMDDVIAYYVNRQR